MLCRILPNKIFIKMMSKSKEQNYAAIICSSYEIDESLLNKTEKKLILYFDDTLVNKPTAFNEKLAMQIKNFVDELSCDVLYICCDCGESRSSAIAAAILRSLRQSDWHIWTNPSYHPNIRVYEMLCKALGVKVTNLSIKYRAWLSKRALSKAIRR